MTDSENGGAKAKSRGKDHTSARSEAAQFLADLNKPSERVRTAKELYRYVSVSLKNEEAQFVEEFVGYLDSKDNQSVIYEYIYSDNLETRKVGIMLIVCLADTSVGGNRIVWYANFLIKALTFPKNDENTMDLAARALVYLIQTSKSLSADLLEKCLDHCLEWLQEVNRNETRRLAAVLLARELAMFTSTSFFLRANVFFRNIFIVIRDPKHTVRIAAIEALHAALTITSQREAKQKTEWYQTCLNEALKTMDMPQSELAHPLSHEDRIHSMLLVLNELARIADASFEKTCLEASGIHHETTSIEEPIEWLIQPRVTVTVESTTAKMLVLQDFSKIIQKAREAAQCRNVHVQVVLLQLFPRLSSWEQCSDEQRNGMFCEMKAIMPKQPVLTALLSLGLMVLQRPKMFSAHSSQVAGKCKEILKTAITKKMTTVDRNVFIYLKLYVRAYKDAVFNEMKNMLDILFSIPLCKDLTSLLHEITHSIPSLIMDVQDGLMKVLYHKLTNQHLPGKIDPPRKPLLPQNPIEVRPECEKDIVLALDTLGSFEFQRHSLQMCMQYIAEGYLVSESVPVRLAAVRCCTAILVPFVKVYNSVHREHRQWVLELIHGVLKCLVSVGVIDSKLVVRLCVFKCFGEADQQFLSHLAQPQMLELLFMSLHDEKLEMQEAAVCLLGRLSELNPALVLPRMRRVLLETLSQLTNSGQARLEQHSARLLVQVSRQSPKFMRPYLGPLLTALLPKLRMELKHVDVTVQVLNAISELCIVGGAEVVKSIDPLFGKLTQLITDSSSLHRREAALQCIGRMCRATAYVVDPYKDHPTLLDDLLRLLKTEMSSSMRRQAIKVLGILGAIDPYTHKVFTGAVQSANSISTALSLPMNRHDAGDPRQDIIQWFNYEKCTLEEFYPAITIANLMVMIQDEAFTQYYNVIINSLLTIFRSLGDTYPQYVQQVVPRLMEVTRSCKGRGSQREFFLRHLAQLVAIIKTHAKPYLKQIFSLIADAWSEDQSVKLTVVSVLEQIGTALGQDFSPFVAELIPYLLQVVQTDREPERKITKQVLSCVRSLSGCLTPHLQLVLPPVLSIADEKIVPMSVRQAALDTVLHLARSDDVADYAPRLMQTWQKCIEYPPLQPQLQELLLEIVRQMWKHFHVFKRSVDIKLAKHGLDQGKQHKVYRDLADEAAVSTSNQPPTKEIGTHAVSGTQPIGPNFHRHRKTPTPIVGGLQNQAVNKQRLNYDVVSRAWSVDGLISKEDWTQWLLRLRLAFIKSGSSAALRAAAPVCDLHQHLAKDLFNAAFMSVWTELKEQDQDALTRALTKALTLSNHRDVTQTILNLAEFMDHSEKGPLPIGFRQLGKSAEETKAYAKALRYTEIEIHSKLRRGQDLSVEDCQSLITFANKLNVQEEAAGVVRYAEQRHIPMQGRWYEKLNEWEKALESYETDRIRIKEDLDEIDLGVQVADPALLRTQLGREQEDIAEHELRCLEVLGRWTELNKKSKNVKHKKPKMTVIAARGAWAVGDWDRMKDHVTHLNENSQDGSLLRAVLAVRNNQYENATTYIDKVRDMYDSDLTAMASESYERAYAPMIQVQQLAELEEAIEYKMRPERRPRIALLWSRRLQGCRQNIEQWQRLLMLRSLVLSPQEMHPLRVKFASLCRQQGKLSMCRSVLRDLLQLPADAPLHTATVPHDRPQLVLALCKQLWLDDMKNMAIQTLDSLVKHLDRLPPNSHSIEGARLCAKAYLKLGQWTDAQGMRDAPEGMAAVLNPKMMMSSVPPPGMDHLPINEYHAMVNQHHMQHKTSSLMSPQQQEVTKKVLRCYTRSTEYDPRWHKAWHQLASAHLYAMNRERELAKQASQRSVAATSPTPLAMMTQPPPVSVAGMVPPPMHGMPPPPVVPLVHGGIPFIPPPLSPLVMPPTEVRPNLSHAGEAVSCFAKALMLAPGSRLEDTLRLLQLWFDYGEHEEVYIKLRDNIKGLPVETWLEVVPQLMARLDSTDRMAELIRLVIQEIAKTRPQALVYALTVAAKSPNANRAKNAKVMLDLMAEVHTQLVEEARVVSEELVRCAILWHEQWHDGLDDASRLYFQEKNIKAMMDILKPLHEMIDAGPNTLKEQSFNQTYYGDLSDAFKFCMAYERNKNQKELSQAWEIYCQIFKRIAGQLKQLNSLDLNYISPKLMRAKDLQLAVPGTYDPNSPIVGISHIGTHLQVISSKQRPRKMSIFGSNGHEYVFLLKGHEDPRQDERVMQLFGLVNTLLVNNAETCRRNLTIERYSITALSQNSGLIGWVPNCDTLHSMIRDYRDKKKMSLSKEHKLMQMFAPDTEQLTLMQKMQVFQSALDSSPGDDLRHILWLKSPSSEVWFDRRTNYTRSIAVMSMVGYILGLGDRHPSNLMLDRLTGKIVHIDFGDCFDVAMTREKFPEKVPFRLTRMLVNAMEVTGIDGTYRFTCERVLRLLRANKESLLAVLEAFVYDPVINWRLMDGTKKDPGQQKDHVKKAIQQEAPRIVSEHVMGKIRNKLTGREFNTETEVGESDQIDRLIEQATLAENLCQAYIGWCPFW